MTTAAPSAGRVDDAPDAGRRADAAAPAGTPPTAAAETVSAPQPPSTPTLPPTPTVSFACTGAGEVCGPLRAALEHALDNEGWSLRRTGADIELVATVEILEERTDNQFGTTFVVRTYSVQMEGEAPRLNEVLPTMPAQTFSADARLGRERLNENARVAAAAALERMRVFWKRRAQP